MLGLPVDMISIAISCIALVISIATFCFSYNWNIYDRRLKDYEEFNVLFEKGGKFFFDTDMVLLDENIFNDIHHLKINANKIFGKDISGFIEEFSKKLKAARNFKISEQATRNFKYDHEEDVKSRKEKNVLALYFTQDKNNYHKLYAKYGIKI